MSTHQEVCVSALGAKQFEDTRLKASFGKPIIAATYTFSGHPHTVQ